MAKTFLMPARRPETASGAAAPAAPATLTSRGVTTSYRSAFGHDVDVPASTLALLAEHAERVRTGGMPPLVLEAGASHRLLFGTLSVAGGEAVVLEGRLPVRVEPGLHRLFHPDGSVTRVVVTPASLPGAPSGWGWAVQLYAARSRRSWGIGDLTDLAALGRRFAGRASAVIVNPLHASRPGPGQQPSPYSPASRLWLNLGYVDPEAVHGAEEVDLGDLAAAGRALNADRRIDRDAVWALKIEALERIWAATRGRPAREFDRWAAAKGESLRLFAVWSVLAEIHPGPWWSWPEAVRHPRSGHVAAFARQHADRVRFWMWCQWVADRQLAAACGAGTDIVFDLALGFDAGGADAWMWQDLLAFDFEVGCPPDPRNPDGQCWGLPPFDPAALAGAGYGPLLATLRAALRHAAGLRVDHVMGLWRQFWVPRGDGPAAGAYVRYPGDDLLALLRLEAGRAGAWVVGEDMGTVEPHVRDDMAASGMLGYRVAMRTDPATWPAHVVGGVATHDQPTVAGTLDGSDLRALLAAGRSTDLRRVEAQRRLVAGRAGLDPDDPATDRAGVEAAVLAMHEWIARSPARLVVATLDDAAGVSERPNMPGTVDEWPNWRIALPAPAEDIFESDLARRLVEMFERTRGRRAGTAGCAA